MFQIEKHGWFIGYGAFIPIVLLPVVYVVGHHIFKIDPAELIMPAAVLSAVHLLLSPLWGWALKRLRERKDRRKDLPVYQAATVYAMVMCLLIFVFGRYLGRVDTSKAIEEGLLTVIILPISMAVMYRLRTKLLPPTGGSDRVD